MQEATCPLKGQNTRYDQLVEGKLHLEAAWSYQQVRSYDPNLELLRGQVAFYAG